tara:strand:- start:1420 stop:3243 length:1824 start_codon:yes stop_codon:yes gene_type:complete
MKKNILISIFLLFIPFFSAFSQKIYTSDQVKDILSSRQYSYKLIEGLDLKLSQDDVITFYENGAFDYNVGDKNAEGTWVLNEKTLKFTYPDTVRFFKITHFSKNNFSIHEELSDYKFHFEHTFTNRLNFFSITLDNIFKPIVDNIAKVIFFDLSKIIGQNKEVPFIVIWLILGALFFTFKMNFINLRGFNHAISLVKGDYHDPNNKGEVSHFQALTTALSGTVGLGNIAGVAIAISLGGPGATFWMIVAGLIGMSSKFVECTLGVKYRKIDENGVVSGGPMYYLKDGLAKKNLPNLGKFLAILFAILCVGGSIGGGNMFQANQAFAAFKTVFPAMSDFGPLFGLFLAILVGVVIIGGIKSIAKVTEKIVPFMAAIYVGAALIIIGYHFTDLHIVFSKIIKGAFSPEAGLGGFIGVLIVGFKRAAFSNEAGVGSASIAHSAAKTKEPVSEGMVALLEPFIDTIVICTITAIVIIITGSYTNVGGLGGSELTSQAFGSVIWWFPYILTIAIFLFAFSTIISWSYYGLKSWTFLFGQSKATELTYKVLLMFFVVVGSSVNLGSVLDFSDMMILAMAFPNIIGLLFLSSEVKEDLKTYFEKVKNGSIKKFK